MRTSALLIAVAGVVVAVGACSRKHAESVATCESNLAAAWKAQPPSTGLGTAKARTAYEGVLRGILQQYDLPGASVAVTKDGRLVAAFGVGFADPGAQQLAHPDDRFRVASLSKQVTATAVVHLVEDGALSLDDHPFVILSNLQTISGSARNPALATITVRELLQHLGGWNRDFEAVGDPMFDSQVISSSAGIPGPADTTTVIRYMLDKPLTYSPGTTYCYSNFGYAVLGEVVARVSGVPYPDYVQAHVLAPAGATEMAQGRTRLSDRADGEVFYQGYPGEPLVPSVFPGDPPGVPWEYGGFYLEAMAAHGAWIASPVDMVRFATTIDGKTTRPDQLTGASEAEMFADPHVPTCRVDGGTDPENANYWYGFGLQANSYGNYWHTGSLPGTATEDVIAGNGFTWAIFSNSRTAGGAELGGIDQHGWDPIGSVTQWGSRDLFDQFPAFTAWMPQSAFDSALAAADGAGNHATRVEARLESNGAVSFRARFAPLPTGMTQENATLLDCPAYTARDRAALAAGRARVSVQSFVDGTGVRRFQAVWATPP